MWAVVLAGGAATRLGGVDKPALRVGPGTLLDGVLGRALALTGDPGRIVVVGPARPVAAAVRWTREDPPGSGPLAALAAGLAALPADVGADRAAGAETDAGANVGADRDAAAGADRAAEAGVGADARVAARRDDDVVALLAADLAGLRADTLPRLHRALLADPGLAGVLLRDGEGRAQWLCGIWRAGPLRAALPADPAGGSLRSALRPLRPAELAARPGETADVDTEADLARARRERG